MSGYGELVATNDLTGLAHTARLDVLFTGYAADLVAGTVSLIRDGDRVVVVDPGMVPARAAILDPLEELGVSPRDVTDVVLSHHHPDHTVNIALFGEIPVHDFQASIIVTAGTPGRRTEYTSPHPCGCSPPPVTPPRT